MLLVWPASRGLIEAVQKLCLGSYWTDKQRPNRGQLATDCCSLRTMSVPVLLHNAPFPWFPRDADGLQPWARLCSRRWAGPQMVCRLKETLSLWDPSLIPDTVWLWWGREVQTSKALLWLYSLSRAGPLTVCSTPTSAFRGALSPPTSPQWAASSLPELSTALTQVSEQACCLRPFARGNVHFPKESRHLAKPFLSFFF